MANTLKAAKLNSPSFFFARVWENSVGRQEINIYGPSRKNAHFLDVFIFQKLLIRVI